MKKTKHLGLAVALAAMLAIGAGAGLVSEVGKGVGASGDLVFTIEQEAAGFNKDCDNAVTTHTITASGSTVTMSLISDNVKCRTDSSKTKYYGYMMFNKNKGFMYSSAAIDGYYVSQIEATFSGGTSTAGKVIGVFGASALSVLQTENVNGAVAINGSYSVSNTDKSLVYWNFSTALKNVQVVTLVITYSETETDPTAPKLTLDKSSMALEISQTGDLVASVANFGETVTYSWESGDVEVATVTAKAEPNKATVEAVAIGTAMVKVNASDGTNSLDATCKVTVSAPSAGMKSYEKLTDVADLDGRKVLIVAQGDTYCVAATAVNKDKPFLSVANVTISENIVQAEIAASADDEGRAHEFVIEASGTNYKIKDPLVDKYIGWAADNSAIYSTTAKEIELSITISAAGEVEIKNVDTAARKLQYNKANPRFAFYTSTQVAISLYALEEGPVVPAALSAEGKAWGEGFLSTLKGECGPGGTYEYALRKETWNEQAASYDVLAAGDKAIFKGAAADPDGSVEQKVASLYDFVLGKDAYAGYADFMGRNPAGSRGDLRLDKGEIEPNVLIAIISVIALLSVTGIVTFTTIKRRKVSQ